MRDGVIADRASAYADVLSKSLHLDGPLLDLMGRLTNKPVWKLLGPSVRERVVHKDIRVGGFLGNRELASMAEAAGASSVPYNWASEIGKYMGQQLAKAGRAVTAAEDDRSTCDVITAEGYEFKNGSFSVSDAPGLGFTVNPAVYQERYARSETVVS
jgi:L-alanine-DL-glutamate epimerase-like enolase superfamily enzyme